MFTLLHFHSILIWLIENSLQIKMKLIAYELDVHTHVNGLWTNYKRKSLDSILSKIKECSSTGPQSKYSLNSLIKLNYGKKIRDCINQKLHS